MNNSIEEDVFQNCSKDVIPKSEIKEKIETYRRVISDSNDGDLIHDLRNKIHVLEELL